jgi:hypothetical protein
MALVPTGRYPVCNKNETLPRPKWRGIYPQVIEMGANTVDIGKTIHSHPTLGESIGMAAEIAHGSCTEVSRAKK